MTEMDCCETYPKINTLKELIAEFHKIFSSDKVDIDHAKKVLESYQSNPKDWKQYAIFDQHRLVIIIIYWTLLLVLGKL